MPAPWPDNAFPATFGPESGTGTSLTFTVPTGVLIQVESVYAEVTTGAIPAQPLLTVRTQSGVVIARKRQVEGIDVFSDGSATWALRLSDDEGTGGQPDIPLNVGEIGFGIDPGQDSYVGTLVFYNTIEAGDGILALAFAPSKPSALEAAGRPNGVEDTVGNTYTLLTDFRWEANPPNVNEGISGALYFCQSSVAALTPGSAIIAATWDNPVFDRNLYTWQVRHDGGANIPTVIDQTGDNDAAVFASNQVTLNPPLWTNTRDNSLSMAIFLTAKVGGTGGFSSVPGFIGYFQAQFRSQTGSKQTYLRNAQTFGADIVLPRSRSGFDQPPEWDTGFLEAQQQVSSGIRPGQAYVSGANAWKGIIILGFD